MSKYTPPQAPMSYSPEALVNLLWQELFSLGQVVGNDREVRAVSASYTIQDSDEVVLVDAAAAPVTITLPNAGASAKRTLIVKRVNSGANGVTIDGAGADTIDGATTLALASQYATARLVSDGAKWWVI